jgi:hypothetical protein
MQWNDCLMPDAEQRREWVEMEFPGFRGHPKTACGTSRSDANGDTQYSLERHAHFNLVTEQSRPGAAARK